MVACKEGAGSSWFMQFASVCKSSWFLNVLNCAWGLSFIYLEMIFFIESQHSATQFIHQISPGLWDGKPGCPSYRSTLERWAQTAVHMLCMDNHGHLHAMCVCVSTSEKCEGRMMVHAHRVHILHKYVNIHVLGLRTLNKERKRERESTTSPIFFCHHSFVRSTERPMVRPCESTWRLQYDFLCLAAFSSFSLANCWTRNDTVKSLSLSQLSPKVGQSNISIHIIFSLQQMLDSARFCCQEKTGKYQR